MRHGGFVIGFVALVFASLVSSVGCEATNECAFGQTRVPVEASRGTLRNAEFICLDPANANDAGHGDAEKSVGAGGTIGGFLDASPALARDAVARMRSPLMRTPRTRTPLMRTPRMRTPQATWWTNDAGAPPPVLEFRAQIAVAGARITLSAAASDAASPGGSATAVVAGGLLTTVCAVGPGTAAAKLFPAAGATTPAGMGWDGTTLTLTVRRPGGILELALFSP